MCWIRGGVERWASNTFVGKRQVEGGTKSQYVFFFFYVLLTVHLGRFVSVITQLDAQNFCVTISLFNASTCFEHMFSKHVEAWNKLIVK